MPPVLPSHRAGLAAEDLAQPMRAGRAVRIVGAGIGAGANAISAANSNVIKVENGAKNFASCKSAASKNRVNVSSPV